MKAKASAKSLKMNVRWSLPSLIAQPGSVPRRRLASSSVRTFGRATGDTSGRGRRRDHGGALDVLVPDLARVEALEILGELLEGLVEARQRLALPGERCRPREDEVLDVRMVDASLL